MKLEREMVKIVYMMNLESAKSPPFCQVILSPLLYVIVNMFAMLLAPPHALTQKKFPSTPTLHNGKKFSL